MYVIDYPLCSAHRKGYPLGPRGVVLYGAHFPNPMGLDARVMLADNVLALVSLSNILSQVRHYQQMFDRIGTSQCGFCVVHQEAVIPSTLLKN